MNLPSAGHGLGSCLGRTEQRLKSERSRPTPHAQGLVTGESFLSPSHFVCVCAWLCPPLHQLSLCDCLAWRLSVFLGQSLRSLVSQAVPVPFCIPLKESCPVGPRGGTPGLLGLVARPGFISSGVLHGKTSRVPAASCRPLRISCEFRLDSGAPAHGWRSSLAVFTLCETTVSLLGC